MAHWREEYLAALAVRDQREKANVALYEAYTHLADRTAALTTPIGAAASPAVDQSSIHRETQRTVSLGATAKKQPTETSVSPTDLLNAARGELSEAQRFRSELQDKLNRVTAEVEKLRKKNTQDARRINALESERLQLNSRLKDRDEELRGKAKLLEDFQDEMATLNLQLNMADQKSNKLQHENQELVDRWMARMGQEADAMNDASKFS
ncbi:Autophagy-related protein 16 [Penicillium lividum]|nr:Autophagy-related protein 16 [Penicillium lividum]